MSCRDGMLAADVGPERAYSPAAPLGLRGFQRMA